MTSPVPDTTRQLSRSQAQRRQKIIDAALALCLSEGHAQTQMRDIADTAGLALGTVYRYFPSKELLLASVFEKWCEGYWDMLGVASEGQANMDRLIDLACRSAQAYIDEPNILLMINSLRSGVEPVISEKFGEITHRAAQFFLDNLHGLPDEAAVGIVDTVFCVLQVKLSVWGVGQITTEQVYQDIAKAVRLLLEFRDET